MSITKEVKRRNLIFVTGNAISEYSTVACNLDMHLYKSVHIDQPKADYNDFQTSRESGAAKSIIFSQVLFYGTLPSRRNVIISAPNMTLRTILQFLIIFEDIPVNVYFVVDDRMTITSSQERDIINTETIST